MRLRRFAEPLTDWERKAAAKGWDYASLAWEKKKWPLWKCRNDEHRLIFEAMSNIALDMLPFELVAGVDSYSDFRYQIYMAIKSDDAKWLNELCDNPLARDIIIRQQVLKHKPRRRLAHVLDLEWASKQVDQLKQIWRDEYDLVNRPSKPFVEEIIARRSSRMGMPMTATALKDYRDHHGRTPV